MTKLLTEFRTIYFIGMGGIAMQGLAKYCQSLGAKVSGSDLVTTGHRPDRIQEAKPDLVIKSAAITQQSPGWVEVEAARRQGIPVKDRAWLVGQLMRERNRYGIAIAGAHGKSTTTAMVGKVLVEAGLDPVILGGAVMLDWGDSVRIPSKISKSLPRPASSAGGRQAGEIRNPKKIQNSRFKIQNFIVAEACEYQKQFLKFAPKAVIITNIDQEHLDTYPKGLPQIVRAFRDFIRLVPTSGLAVVNGDDPNCQLVAKSARCRVKFFHSKRPWPGLRLKMLGDFNLANATAAARLAHELGVGSQTIKRALNQFTGLARRLYRQGQYQGALLYDDYGHHPTEIQKTLAVVKLSFPSRRLVVVFQAHQYLRSKQLLAGFRSAFSQADLVVIAPIFEVVGRDDPKVISNREFVDKIDHQAKIFIDDSSYRQVIDYLKKIIRPDDLVITIGATPIYKVTEELARYNERPPHH